MPELALDQRQRDPLAQQLDSMRMPHLMRRKPAPHASLNGEVAKLRPHCGGAPRAAAGRPVDHAEQRPGRERRALRRPVGQDRPCPGVDPDLATPVTLCLAANYVALSGESSLAGGDLACGVDIVGRLEALEEGE